MTSMGALGEDRPVGMYLDNVRVCDEAVGGTRGGALAYALRGIGLSLRMHLTNRETELRR
jgi:hypothetical protein